MKVLYLNNQIQITGKYTSVELKETMLGVIENSKNKNNKSLLFDFSNANLNSFNFCHNIIEEIFENIPNGELFRISVVVNNPVSTAIFILLKNRLVAKNIHIELFYHKKNAICWLEDYSLPFN